jgi:protein-L-isoaspartate O-methyltransferase
MAAAGLVDAEAEEMELICFGGAALAWEVVGEAGLVVTVEIAPETFCLARDHLLALDYGRVEVVLGGGSLGFPVS